MKYFKTLCLFLFAFQMLFLVSCGGDDCDSSTFSESIQTALTDFTAIQNAYIADPTDANCEALIKGYSDYIDNLKEWSDCANTLDDANFEETLRLAEQSADDFEC